MKNPPLPQLLIAAPFLILGSWCLLLPGQIESLMFRPEFQHNSATTHLLIGCFGAQAVIGGVFAVLSRFQRATYIGYGILLLPFFGFNYYFFAVVPMFNSWMALDFVANLMMLSVCVWGARTTHN